MRLLLKIAVPVLVLGLLVWFGVPALLETTWARETVKDSLSQGTGRQVELGALGFGWTRGLQVEDVVVHQKEPAQEAIGPLFSLAALELRLGFLDMLQQRIALDRIAAERPAITLIRDEQGVFNIQDLLGPEKEAEEKTRGPEVRAVLAVEDGRLLFVDRGLETRLEVTGLDADARWDKGRLDLEGRCRLNGGPVRFKGHADLAKQPAPFKLEELTADGCRLTVNMAHLGLLLPVLGQRPQEASGTLRLQLEDLSGEGFTLEELSRTLKARGTVEVRGGTVLSGPLAAIFQAVAGLLKEDSPAVDGDGGTALEVRLMRSSFRIAGGAVRSDDIRVEGPGMDLRLAGSTSLDGALDYQVRLHGLGRMLGKTEAVQRVLGEDGTLPLRLTGSLGDPEVTVDLEDTLRRALRRELGGRLEKELGEQVPPELRRLLPILGGGNKKKDDGRDR